jgi:hypothetical protein
MKDPTPSVMFSLGFQFFAPFAELVERGINPKVKDVF